MLLMKRNRLLIHKRDDLQPVAYPAQKFGRPKNFGGAKLSDFRRIPLFCLLKRLSKHKMTIFSKNLGGHGPFGPLLATPMSTTVPH